RPTVEGDPHIYQGGVIDPFLVSGGTTVMPGEPVGLSVRSLHSTAPSVSLTATNFTASHRVTKDGQLAYGPFAATVSTDTNGFETDSDWTGPCDTPSGPCSLHA